MKGKILMNMKPLRDFLLVTKNESPKKTVGGLFMPDTVEEKVVTGTVVAVGSGRLSLDGSVVPLEISVGDQVVFNKNYAIELKQDETTYLLLKEEQVFCVCK